MACGTLVYSHKEGLWVMRVMKATLVDKHGEKLAELDLELTGAEQYGGTVTQSYPLYRPGSNRRPGLHGRHGRGPGQLSHLHLPRE